MSNKIDKRILEMEFDNKAFKDNVTDTQGALEGLSKSLEMEDAGKGLDKVETKFSAVSALAFGALASLGGMAVDTGLKLASSLWDPMVEGGSKRALAIEQAKFQFKGLGLDVEATMAAALYAVKGTAFGLDEAATAAAALGASRVPIDKMGESLRAISGVAALSGSSYADVADVFTKVAGQGRLMGDDLNRLAARGVNAAATLSQAFGVTEGDIREMVSKGEIDFATFSRVMDQAFGENATKASDTFTGAASNMRAALARIGAAFATADFEAQRVQLNAFTPAIDNFAAALAPVVAVFTEFVNMKAEGIKTILDALNFSELPDQPPPFFQGLKNIFEFLISIARPIHDAFKEIFPPATADQIKGIAQSFLTFTERLKLSEEASANLKSTFKGLFAIFDIGWMIIREVINLFMRLFGAMDGGNVNVLEITGNIGDFIVKIRDAMKNGEGFVGWFKKLGDGIQNVIDWFKELFATIGAHGERTTFSFTQAWENLINVFKKIGEFFKPVIQWVKEAFGNIRDVFVDTFQSMDWNVVFGALQIGALGGIGAGIFALIKRIKDGIGFDFGANGGFFATVKEAFSGLTDTFEAMQQKLKADILIKIATAIGIMAASLLILSFIEPERLSSAMAGIVTSLALLIGTMALMIKFINPASMTKFTVLSFNMQLLAAAMVTMAIAMGILALALKVFGDLKWDEIGKGLTGMAGAVTILVVAMKILSKGAGWAQLGTGSAILLAATGLLILSQAMEQFTQFDWDEIGRGLTSMFAAVAIMTGGMMLLGKVKPGAVMGGGVAVLLAATSLLLVGKALTTFATFDWDEIGRGLTAMGGAMAIVALSIAFLPPSSAVGALGILVVSLVLVKIAEALQKFAEMSWDEIGRALTVMAGGLAILAGAMALMGIPIVLLGSIGILAASAALMMLAPALVLLGTMSWDDIGRGLTMLAASLAIMAVLGLLMIPASVGFLLLGAGILAIGGGVLMAAQGTMLFALAIGALAAAASLGAPVIGAALDVIIQKIPEMFTAFAEGVINFAVTIAEGATEFTNAANTLIAAMIEGINQNAPAIIDTMWMLVLMLKDKAVEGAPLFVDAGITILIAFMAGLNKRIDTLILLGTAFIVKLITGIGDSAYMIVTAAGNTVLKFVNGLTDYINQNSGKFNAAGSRLVVAIVNGVSSAIENSGSLMRWAGARIGNAILEGAKNALAINSPSKKFRDEVMGSVFEGVEDGGDKGMHRAARTGTAIGDSMLYAVKKSVDHIRDAVATDMSFSPTIRPVVDMTNLEESSSRVGSMFETPTIDLSKSYVSAASLLEAREQAEAAAAEERESREDNSGGDTYNYNQTITSPKAISASEAYRNGKNLINSKKEG